MKFVRLSSNFPVTKVENNLKKANYYKDGDEAYTIWDVGDFDKNQLGIHLSYNSDKKKIVAYHEDGVEHNSMRTRLGEGHFSILFVAYEIWFLFTFKGKSPFVISVPVALVCYICRKFGL